MSPRAVPTEGFTEFRTTIIYAGLVYKPATSPADEILWPDRSHINIRLPEMPHGHEGWVYHTDLSPGLGAVPSYYLGSLVDLTINCPTDNRWYLLRHDPYQESSNPLGSTLTVGTGDTHVPVGGEVYIHCDPALSGVGGLAGVPQIVDARGRTSRGGWLIAGAALSVLGIAIVGAVRLTKRRV